MVLSLAFSTSPLLRFFCATTREINVDVKLEPGQDEARSLVSLCLRHHIMATRFARRGHGPSFIIAPSVPFSRSDRSRSSPTTRPTPNCRRTGNQFCPLFALLRQFASQSAARAAAGAALATMWLVPHQADAVAQARPAAAAPPESSRRALLRRFAKPRSR
jgi:hypothetical protein